VSWFEHGGSTIYYDEDGQGQPGPLPARLVREHRRVRPTARGARSTVPGDFGRPSGSRRSGPQPREYPSTYYHDDASSLLALIEGLGIASAHVVGFSDGGEIALVMAERDAPAVRTVSAWGAAARMVLPEETIDMFATLIDSPALGMEGFSEHLKAKYGVDNARAMTRNVAVAWRAILTGGGDIARAAAGTITAPTLLITGEEDFFAPPPVVSELAAAIPDARFEEVKGAGHSVHESHGDWLNRTIVGFIGEHTPAAQPTV
jgi:valacyclovir hydrolase